MQAQIPQKLNVRESSRELELMYGNGDAFCLSSEMLRALSPSAEVRGHGQPVLQVGKKNVQITGIEMVGNYAIKIIFSDGHDSGLYDWSYLYDLCINKEQYWDDYLQQLHTAGESRDPAVSIVRLV
ncbi:1-(5-phosphoribosyl)-5-((5-phosphoribosylamino)methylideneamino)imidazole-4-carboxamide isomerase [Endozoicomonas sp. OPT23]|uniref:gamma-butyrobetaine hydroxylase-like domain-containing protein n=1 Tax=Endozoicomonas sp. OPT23 TaxID=2072845 RepID=UPI00129C09BE|nr:DUF971 domain-containing protein [Endozoicomonas sp. OPT23]MRI31969.1 1-(5-phosphoribosyl)-5-((5-phosphoribosylamino)methylideneamino)imidazole-4-carboxamide isomerase [Endozoicomonas sp. OPT23]